MKLDQFILKFSILFDWFWTLEIKVLVNWVIGKVLTRLESFEKESAPVRRYPFPRWMDGGSRRTDRRTKDTLRTFHRTPAKKFIRYGRWNGQLSMKPFILCALAILEQLLRKQFWSWSERWLRNFQWRSPRLCKCELGPSGYFNDDDSSVQFSYLENCLGTRRRCFGESDEKELKRKILEWACCLWHFM